MIPTFQTILEQQTGCLSEVQTYGLETAPENNQFIFGGNNWNISGAFNFLYQLIFVTAVDIEFGPGNQTWQEYLCYLTSVTRTSWGVVCYYKFNVDGLEFRDDGMGNLIPWFFGSYNGFCCYPQPMNDWFSTLEGVSLLPPKFTNGCCITLNALGTKGLITKHTIVSTTGGSTPIMLAPAGPLDVEYVELLENGIVNYTCSEAQAIIFWIGLTLDDHLPTINFDPESFNLLAFAYPN